MPYGKVKTDSIIYDNNGTDVELQSANIVDSAGVESAINTKLTAEIGTSIQPYDADTAKLDVAQTFTNTVSIAVCNPDNLNIQKGVTESNESVGVISSSVTIDLLEGTYFSSTCSSNTTFVFGNYASGSTRVNSFTLRVTCTGSGTTLTWPSAVIWDSGTAPTLTDNKTHIFVFTTDDGGTTVRGAALVDYNA